MKELKFYLLGELGEITSSKRIFQSEYVDDGIPFYRTKEIKELANKEPISNELFISRERYEEIKVKFGVPEVGDILITAIGTVGEIYIVENEKEFYFKDGNILWLKGFKDVDPFFLRYLLSSLINELQNLSSGSAYKALPITKLKEYKIPLPPLEEQRRIAAILDKADGVRRKRKEAIRLTEELLKSTFLEMFGDPVTNPKGWEVESLGDLVEFRTGKLDSNAAVENGRYPFFTCSRVPFSIDEYAFDCEALLLAGNNASADYWVKHYKGKFNAYQRTYILNLKNERISYFYMQKALDLRLNELKQSSRGTNTKYLTLTILKPIKIQLPNIEVQDKYEAFCRSQETQRGRLTQAFEQSENLFNSLLQRAFRGEL